MSEIHGETGILRDSYAVMGALWCSSPDVDVDEARKDARALVGRLDGVDKESATSLSRFLEAEPVAEQEWVGLFELEPKCPLYLGSHVYDEPKTCASAGICDRNEYMIELIGVYKHFGRAPNGRELPDFLPLMVDFLAETAEAHDDPVRERFLKEYMLPFLPPMKKKLESVSTPYLHLLDALENIINHELKRGREAYAG